MIHPDLVGKKGPNNSTTLGSMIGRVDDGLEPDLIVGMDALAHLHVYIAYREHKPYVMPPDQPAAPNAGR